ncbi:MAG: carbohydrate porin [Methylococcaceae bacterium]|jgi:hypothetical protein
MHIFKALFLCTFLGSATVHAETSPVEETDESGDFSIMQALSKQGWHDLNNERWNAYGQATYISSVKDAFPAAYSNLNGTPNSLSTKAERSFTATTTFYLGFKAWTGGEFYASPEMISELPLSGLKGLGASIQNFELQKNGSESALWYLARVFYRQTINLGGEQFAVGSGPLQLAGLQSSRRFVLTAGNYSVLDIFDKNAYASDLRHQFFSLAFLANSAYDFAADARGYTWGISGEYFFDNWTFRFGRFITPKDPNQLPLNSAIFKFYGDQAELEHRHLLAGQAGAVRLLVYRNRENIGSFRDAINAFNNDPNQNAVNCVNFNYASNNASAPDLCYVRKANIKWGIGINLEQSLSPDIGFFLRGLYSDGKTEVYSYASSDRSLSFGTAIKGTRWGRPKDVLGLGYAQSWLSQDHIDFLNLGGVDGFIGDGRINYKPERIADIYYQCHIFSSTWLSLDYQHVANPAYNSARGPVDIYGARVHFEF